MSLKKPRKNKRSPKKKGFVQLVIVPLGISLFINVVISAFSSANPPANVNFFNSFFKAFISMKNILWALIGYIATNLFESRELYGPDYGTLQTLKGLLNEFPFPLIQYAKRRITDSVDQIDTEVRDLQYGGLQKQSFSDKIKIIQSLIDDLGPNLTRFWATTLDPPAAMWKNYQPFFRLQEEKLRNVNDKKRTVVLRRDEMAIQIRSSSEELKEFIRWHHDNHFKLLFLIDENNQFLSLLRQFIPSLEGDKAITDFAVLGDEWVFGEVKNPVQPSKEQDDRLLRLYGRKGMVFGDIPIGFVDDYIRLYNDMWEHWIGSKWPVMVPVQVFSECSRYERKQKISDKTEQHYLRTMSFPDAPQCFTELLNLISKSTDPIIAVDIAPLKSDLSDWILNNDYVRWKDATIDAAKKGCKCARLYVLKKRMDSMASRQEAYEKIFLPQIKAGVEIILANANTLWSRELPIHDFIVAGNLFCLSLDWDEQFASNQVCVNKNLEHPETFAWYKNIFDNIVSSGLAKGINSLDERQVLNFLENLSW